MHKTFLAAAALAMLAGAPAIASADSGPAQQTTAAPARTVPAQGTLFQRLFGHRTYARNRTVYGDPFNGTQVKPNQVIIAPVGA